MSSPYGPGGNDPQQQWGQQPYGAPGTPSGGFPAQGGGYQQQQQPYGYQPTQQYPAMQGGGYNPQQQPYGYPGQPGYPGQAPKKKSAAWLWILVGVVVLCAAVFAVTAFVAPGFLNKKVFDANAVQEGVKSILTGKYNIEKVESVSCPSGKEVKKDSQFTCDVTIDGEKRTVNITVRTEAGEYEVAPPSDK